MSHLYEQDEEALALCAGSMHGRLAFLASEERIVRQALPKI